MDHHIISHFLEGGAAYWVVSAAISTMPPYKGSNYWAVWGSAFLQFIGANLKNIIPGAPKTN